jgi:uncharacterized protein YdiU (UPF0061 family)
MHHLGVPTTRALSLVVTGEQVVRDMFYDGHPRPEPGAIVCRVAPSFTRFGHFEILAARGDIELLRQLADYTIRADFPHLSGRTPYNARNRYVAWFEEVCRNTATMIVQWMRVGFVHGVMNTDNMSILGLTIDYGPYGWLEDYDPNWTPNTTDAGQRRYRFGQQPNIALWNLTQLANALYPLIEQVEPLQEALQHYATAFNHGWKAMMANKLGLQSLEASGDEALLTELQTILQLLETDMSIFYRQLAQIGTAMEPRSTDAADASTNAALMQPLLEAYYRPEQLTDENQARISNWLRQYIARLRQEHTPDAVRQERMHAVNPKYVLRNYLAQLAIDKAEHGDYSGVHELQAVLRRPYDAQPDQEIYAQKRPDWARQRPGCSMLSCSS